MIINSLKLKNIRSYTDNEIKFPQGSIMLSGDIGTGKTSILLGIEFALFGIIRGQISGSTLLRHGKQEGFVELDFSIEKTNVIIRRNLKRSSKSIAQDSGYIIIDGQKQELTPIELKSKILELIGYPDELVTKSKSFIFRYTVYTPQEEMKHILFESKDERLNVLRRIFDIDKYKRIKENTLNYIREIKTKRTELETRIEDLNEKKIELENYNQKVKLMIEEAQKVQIIIEQIKLEVKFKEEKVKEFEESIKQIDLTKNQIEIKTNNLNNNKKTISENEEELKYANQNIEKLEKELEGFEKIDLEILKKKRVEFEERKLKLKENLEKINGREAEFNANKNHSQEIINKLFSMDECPVCEQKVDLNHKERVKTRETDKIEELQTSLNKLVDLKSQRKEEIDILEKELQVIIYSQNKQEVIVLQNERLKEYREKKELIMKEQVKAKTEIETLEKEVEELKKRIKSTIDIEEKHFEAKKNMNETINKQKYEEIKKAEFLREQQTIEHVKVRIEEEIKKKEESKKQLTSLQEIQNWLIKFFLNVIYLMEKQILLHVHNEFNEYFQEWFNILIEDENLNVRLDETFTPIIEQNGYETYVENLSGGERTSVALAYRLALNKVINDFIGTIKTKDLLILDEPTDGFSSDQLDKIRELLEQINIKQIILVSHEPKLESYVDHIIRIHKEEHESKIII